MIRTHGLCVSAAVLFQLSYKDPYFGKNWPAPNVRVFTVQLREDCSANAEAMGSPNHVDVPKFFFFVLICSCLNYNYHCDDHIFIANLYFRSSRHLHSKLVIFSYSKFPYPFHILQEKKPSVVHLLHCKELHNVLVL